MTPTELLKEIEQYREWHKALYERDENVPEEFYHLEIKYRGTDINHWLIARVKKLTEALEQVGAYVCMIECNGLKSNTPNNSGGIHFYNCQLTRRALEEE